MSKLKVALCGTCGTTGFAWAAQTLLGDLERHPYFDLVGLVAERPADEGSTFGQAMREWYEDRPLKPEYREMRILPPNGRVLREEAGVGLVISCLPPDLSKRIDMCLAESGMPVVSESPGLRDVDDIPLVVPEINPDHLSIIPAQRAHHGWSTGFIVSNPVCTITLLTLSIKPILDAFGIERVILTTLQAMSGAGKTGLTAMTMVDNLIPYIYQEEEKLSREGLKILGRIENEHIAPAQFPISSTCTRVPVLDGHTGAVWIQCERPVTLPQVAEAFREFKAPERAQGLPSAPEHSVIVTEAPDRPQPRLDRSAGNGKSVTVGRIRLDDALPNGIKYVVSGHNRNRGTHGNTLLNAELLYKTGLVC